MANTTRWVIDTAFTAIAFTATDLNSLPTGGGALSTTAVTNSTTLDMYADVSFVLTTGGATTVYSFMGLFLLPLNQDGSTYGDGYVSSTTTQPSTTYFVGAAIPKVGVTGAITGMFRGIILPPGDFKYAIGNSLSVALAATAALTLKHKSYNENLNF